MAREITTWEVKDGKLEELRATMPRLEKELENWIGSNPAILGQDILLIGEQVQTKSGPVDFLGITKDLNTVIIELKRDRLPREVLAQAIDYASDIATWGIEKLNEVCKEFTKGDKNLEEALIESFGSVDLENLPINQEQKILIVGTGTEEALERMIEWLSKRYGVNINATLFRYVKTRKGDELLARTMVLPEEVVSQRSRKGTRIAMSDTPGSYSDGELKDRLKDYLSKPRRVRRLIKEILLPLCLKHDVVQRDDIIQVLKKDDPKVKAGSKRAGTVLSTISREIGYAQNDFLRQIIRYEKDEQEKDNYNIDPKYRKIAEMVLEEVRG